MEGGMGGQVPKDLGEWSTMPGVRGRAELMRFGRVVAIFHASFHPTRGNVVDWSLKSDGYAGEWSWALDVIENLSLTCVVAPIDFDGLEFKVLPSGLHQVEQDVVYALLPSTCAVR
jgi:hypothetical protein